MSQNRKGFFFNFNLYTYFFFLFQTSVEMNPVDGKPARPTSISLNNDHDDEDHTEVDEEHDGVTFKV